MTYGISYFMLTRVISLMYMLDHKKKFSHTLAIDSPFQTFAVGLLVEFILALPLLSPELIILLNLSDLHYCAV